MSLMLIFLYYVPLTVGQTLAEKGFLPAAVGLWMPNVAFLIFGAWLFQKAATESRFGAFDRVEIWSAEARRWVAEWFARRRGIDKDEPPPPPKEEASSDVNTSERETSERRPDDGDAPEPPANEERKSIGRRRAS